MSPRCLLLVTAVAGCGPAPKPRAATSATPVAAPSSAPSPTPSPTPAGEPKTYDGVKAAVDRLDQADAKVDGGTAWDMLTAIGQATMSCDDYIKVVAGCPKLVQGTTLSIALNAGGTSAAVTTSAGAAQGGTYTWQMVYESGHWKHQPSDGAMIWMGLGANKALTMLRNEGAC